jgi:hypothetical protein
MLAACLMPAYARPPARPTSLPPTRLALTHHPPTQPPHPLCRQARAELKEDLDLFVVNSIGSLGQSFFVFLLLPIMTALRGMSLTELPGYLAQGE